MRIPSRAFLIDLFGAAVAAAHPDNCVAPHLPAPPAAGRLVILAAGKAAGAMAEVAERHYVDQGGMAAHRVSGLVVTRHGYGRPTEFVRLIEAGHPVPDAAGLAATFETLALADSAGPDDLVLVLISGGASANWIAPALGLSLNEKQALTRALLGSGASISEINTVRKHLSRIKGGRLAERAAPARLVAVGISDVPDNDPAVIGSGPTVPDPTTLMEARAIVTRCGVPVSAAVMRALEDPANETPKPRQPSSPEPLLRWRFGRQKSFVRRRRWRAKPATTVFCWARRSRARPVRSRSSMPGWRASSRRKAATRSFCPAAS